MSPAVRTREPSQPSHAVLRGKVLLEDEDFRDLTYYGQVLQAHGFEVRTCPSPAEGLRCLETESFDFVIVSQGTCAFEGRCLLERVLERDRHTPVVVLARTLSMECYLEAMQLGALDYLEKPVPPAEIAHVVETHVRPHAAAA